MVENPEAIYDGLLIIHNRKIRLYEDYEYMSEFDHYENQKMYKDL